MALVLISRHGRTLSCPTPSGTLDLAATFADENTGGEAPEAGEWEDGLMHQREPWELRKDSLSSDWIAGAIGLGPHQQKS
ncbi:hypothetical protein WCLP8_4130003 [uncultured Gammaproteobacteria bacterium]